MASSRIWYSGIKNLSSAKQFIDMSTATFLQQITLHRCGEPIRSRPVLVHADDIGHVFLPAAYCYHCGVFVCGNHETTDEKEAIEYVKEFMNSGKAIPPEYRPK